MNSGIELTLFTSASNEEIKPEVSQSLQNMASNTFPPVQNGTTKTIKPDPDGCLSLPENKEQACNSLNKDVDHPMKPDFRRDIPSILILFLLYILQGIPLGIMVTIPFLLQARQVPYAEQARFSLAGWPFSLKVIYAPIVDAFYFKRFGRRKSWLIPLQFSIAIFLFVLSFRVDDLLDSVQVVPITIVFFILNFLAATQDITVDGWALTMLRPENVGFAATCNAVGQTLGVVIGYSGFLALNSADFANKFRVVPNDSGLVTFPQFLFFWGIIFAITTTGILFFKKEDPEPEHVDEQHLDICASYKNLWKILCLRNIQYLILFYLTVRVGTAATDSMAKLKLTERGVPKEWIAFFSIPLIPIKLALPVIISKFTVGSNPMGIYIGAIPFCLIFGIVLPIVILATPFFQLPTGEFPTLFYVMLFAVFALQLIPAYTIFVSGMSFSAQISDPAIGGTYMTLINTVSNIGGQWAQTVALAVVDYVGITLSVCSGFIHDIFWVNTTQSQNVTTHNVTVIDFPGGTVVANNNDTLNNFSTSDNVTQIANFHNYTTSPPPVDPCLIKIDGYYVETVFCVLIGSLWLLWGRPTILRLQSLPRSTWRVFK